MIPRSSIFSFSTLRARPRIGRTVVVAVLLLAACEGMARYALRTGRIHRDKSARALIEDYEQQIAAARPQVWLLGNSTLYNGVDVKKLEAATGLTMVKLAHGSATVHASAVMADYYLSRAPVKPQRIILFITKDDLNTNGSRARDSRRYEQFCASPRRRPQEMLALWNCRGDITTIAGSFARRLFRARRPAAASLPAEQPEGGDTRWIFDGRMDSQLQYFTLLTTHYHPDENAIGELAEVIHRHGVASMAVVMLPTTDVYLKFHDQRTPELPFGRLRKEIARLCQQRSIPFVDLGEPSSNYRDFVDASHLNDVGKAKLTPILASHAELFGGTPDLGVPK